MNKIMDCYDPYFKIRIINFRIIIMESYTNTNCKEIQMMFVQKVFNMLAIIGWKWPTLGSLLVLNKCSDYDRPKLHFQKSPYVDDKKTEIERSIFKINTIHINTLTLVSRKFIKGTASKWYDPLFHFLFW